MAYLFYFLGFVMMFRLSEEYGKNGYEPIYYHLVCGLIWPLIIALSLVLDLVSIFRESE